MSSKPAIAQITELAQEPTPLQRGVDSVFRQLCRAFAIGTALLVVALDLQAQARCRLLLDVARVKWACILLNDFLPVGAARRAFADASEREARCAAQLEKAKAKLAEIRI